MKKITLLLLIVFTMTQQAQNKLLSSIDESYNGTSWDNSRGSNYEYDANNNLIAQTYYNWGINGEFGAWQISDKDTYTYNANNKTTQNIYQEWNSTTNQYDNLYKSSYNYNLSGNLIEETYQEWTDSEWENNYKIVVTYDSNNLIDVVINYEWDGLQWVNDYRSIVTYNANNKISQILNEEWISSQWVLEDRDVFIYNENNKIINYTSANWDGSNWIGDYIDNYTIDANGNTISNTSSYNDEQYKTEYSYDASALISSFAHPFKDKTGLDYIYENMLYLNKILSENYFNYDNSTSSYTNNYRTTYSYTSAITLSTKNVEISKNTLKVFPNPANDFIQVLGLTETEQYEVFSILGTKVNKGSIAVNEKIDIQNLTNGLYLLKFKNGSTINFIKK
ncbi:T9SS type A sorting domain-containing protein [Mariniflexile sp.]|uniref:T9SS type A sorting domain-containing protein n=1 Tax=Mariniflexile sp. TaxID=1979402 RepID=UPI0040476F1F